MKIASKVIIVVLLWLIFVNPGSITNIDTARRMQMAHAWWTNTEEGIPGDRLVINVNGQNYIPYDLGQSMLMLPGDWLGTKLAQTIKLDRHQSQQFTEAFVSFFIFLPINLLAILACFRLLKLFGYSEKLAGLSSIIWLLGTTVLFYSTLHQQNNQILLFVLISYQAALAYIKKGHKSLAIFSGIALGIAFLIRITSILHAITVLIFLVGCIISNRNEFKPISKSINSLLLWISGFIPFVLIERILTYYRYGNWRATSSSLHLQIYSKANTLIEANDVIKGNNDSFDFLSLLTKIKLDALLAPLFYPEKSIFLYDPLLLPCLIISLICWKALSLEIRWYLIAGILNFLLHLYIYSWTSEWIRQGQWGARYHITSVHLLLIPLIPLLIRGATKQIKKNTNIFKKITSWFARIVIFLAMLLQFFSIVLPFNLEKTQQKLGVGSRFRMIQRVNNIFYLFDEVPESNIQIGKVIQHSPQLNPNPNLGWGFLPFRLKDRLNGNSPLNKLIPILILLWGLLFILAVTATIWMFI
jgi:hypothetical protein